MPETRSRAQQRATQKHISRKHWQLPTKPFFKTEAKTLPPAWDEGEHEAAVANCMMENVLKKQSKNPPKVDPMKAFTSEELGSLRTVHEHLIMSGLEKAKHDHGVMCPVVNRSFGTENFKLKHYAVVGENASPEAHAAIAAARKKVEENPTLAPWTKLNAQRGAIKRQAQLRATCGASRKPPTPESAQAQRNPTSNPNPSPTPTSAHHTNTPPKPAPNGSPNPAPKPQKAPRNTTKVPCHV